MFNRLGKKIRKTSEGVATTPPSPPDHLLNVLIFAYIITLDSGSVCINLEEFTDDDVFDGSISYHSQDKKKGAFLPGLKVTAQIIDVERAPRTHPFNPNL